MKSFVVVARRRNKTYQPRELAYRRRGLKKDARDDPGGVGSEAVVSVRVCAACRAQATTTTA